MPALRGAKAVGLPAQHFAFIATEKAEPYECAAYRLTEGAMDAGTQLIEALLERYATCWSTSTWPGYPDRVNEVALPDWAWRKIDDQLEEIRR